MLEQPAVITSSRSTERVVEVRAQNDAWPSVSVVIPCYNEERFISEVLANLVAQYDAAPYEIILVDGMSEDATRATVAAFCARHGDARVRVIDNPARSIPAALNLGISAAHGEVIVRMDAHAVPSTDYVRRAVESLQQTDASIVGMPCRVRPGAETLTARAVAAAVSHPFGIGDAKYRLPSTGAAQYVDTVAFGVFRKSLWREVGGFDEGLLTNEDYDFNYRVRARGGRILLEPSAHCLYFARPTIGALARQYYRYGQWKAQMLKRHPRSVRWRHAVAPAFVAALLVLPLAGLWLHAALWLLCAVVGAYTLLALLCAARVARREGEARLIVPLVVAFCVIHLCWGGGFWLGLLPRRRR